MCLTNDCFVSLAEKFRSKLLGTLMFVSAFCLAILIALFVGLGKVLSEISHIEEALKHGQPHFHSSVNLA